MKRCSARWLTAACLSLSAASWACGDEGEQVVAPASSAGSETQADASEPAAPGPEGEAASEGSGRPPEPDDVLRRMATHLAALQRFSFHAEISFDQRARWGELVQLSGAADFEVARPDRVYVDYRDDEAERELWFDGKNVTLLDPVQGFYATRPQPGDIDATVDALRKRFDLTMPLGELISNDPAELLELALGRGVYVGLHDAEGVLCDHLAFRLPRIDLQLWVQADGDPLPRRVVITFRQELDGPRFEAELMDWEVGAAAEQAFQAALPEGARKIEFLEIRGAGG